MKTLTIRTRHLIAMAAMAISTGAIASAQYTFVKLSVPGASWTVVNGISNNNTIVGEYGTSSGYYGFTYNPSTNTWHYPINDPQGSGYTDAMAVNTEGQVVGYYYSQQRDVGFAEWTSGKFSNLFVNGCSENIVGTGINDSPYSTVTGYCMNANLQTVAWESYPADVTFSCLQSNYTVANAINNWMLMVGTVSVDGGQASSGFIATDQGSCTIVNHPGAYNTVLTGVNDLGAITGWYQSSFSGPPQGFILNGSTYTNINVPGAKYTRPGQVNNNGWFVGTYVDSTGASHAFYAMPSSGANTHI